MIGGILEDIAQQWNHALNRELQGVHVPTGITGNQILHAAQLSGSDAGSGSGAHAVFMAIPRPPGGLTLGQGPLHAGPIIANPPPTDTTRPMDTVTIRPNPSASADHRLHGSPIIFGWKPSPNTSIP